MQLTFEVEMKRRAQQDEIEIYFSRREVPLKRTEDGQRQFLALGLGSSVGQSERTAVSRREPRVVYNSHKRQGSLCHTSLHSHVTFSKPRGGFANMAPLPNCPRRKHPPRPPLHFSQCSSPQSIVQVTLVCIAGYVLARRGILDKSTQKVVTFISHLILLTHSSVYSHTAIELHKRQLLHSLPPLLQSRVLPFPRSATILIDLATAHLSFQRSYENYGSSLSSSCLSLACH